MGFMIFLNQTKATGYQLFISTLVLLGFASCAPKSPTSSSESPEAQVREIESMYASYEQELTGIREVRPQDIADVYRDPGIILVDVRTPEEQAVSMIPGAITRSDFEKNQDQYAEKRIILHCTIGYRSGLYAKELALNGIEAENLVGSLLLWAHEGLPLQDSQGNPTIKVHVYGKKWNLVPVGYEGVW